MNADFNFQSFKKDRNLSSLLQGGITWATKIKLSHQLAKSISKIVDDIRSD